MDTGDDRAVSEVVGFILVFSLVVIGFALYQGLVVPDQNRTAEFHHNQAVHRQLQELRNAILATALTGTGAPVTVTLGADYPDRVVASNLGSSTGALSTAPPGAIALHNVTALDPETRDYLGDANASLGPFPTQSITYQPTYAFYDAPPRTVITTTIAFNRFPTGETLPLTDQSLVDGRTITIVTVAGGLSEASPSTVTVDPTAVSAPATPVAVTNGSGPLTLTVPGPLSADDWQTLLADEYDPDDTDPTAHVRAVKPAGDDAVAIVLDPGVTYTIRAARIAVGRATESTEPTYLTGIDGAGASVPENATQPLTVEVRDAYNNPVTGVAINASVVAGPGHMSTATRRSNTRGRAHFVYQAPTDLAATRNVTVEVSFGPTPTAQQRVTFRLTAVDSATGPTASARRTINPPEPLRLVGARPGPGRSVDVTFATVDEAPVEVTHARLGFVYRQGGNPPSAIERIANASTGTVYHAGTLPVGGPLEPLDTRSILVPPGNTTVRVTFDRSVGDGFFTVTLRTTNGTTLTYFIAVE